MMPSSVILAGILSPAVVVVCLVKGVILYFLLKVSVVLRRIFQHAIRRIKAKYGWMGIAKYYFENIKKGPWLNMLLHNGNAMVGKEFLRKIPWRLVILKAGQDAGR